MSQLITLLLLLDAVSAVAVAPFTFAHVSSRGADLVLHHHHLHRCSPPVAAAAPPPINEFSRPQAVAGLRKQASRFSLEATAAECADLAKRFDLQAIGALAANVSLAVVDPRRPRVRAYGSLNARDVVVRSGFRGESSTTMQAAGVPFETFFSGDTTVKGRYDDDDDDSYDEELEDGQIDMGELVAQHLYLYLSELETTKYREFTSDYAPGEVVFDSDPD